MMTKKEQAHIETLLTAAALRVTADVAPDVPIPVHNELAKGWLFIGEQSSYARVGVACSSSIYHAFGRDDQTTTQQPRELYSTRLRALQSLRRAVEQDCMVRLRKVDQMIEEEQRGTQ